MTNALNIPISDLTLLSKLSSYYELSELMGSMQSQLIIGSIKKIEIICYGKAEDSKSISLSFLKGFLSNITDNRINFLNASSVADERGIVISNSFSSDKIPFTNKIKSIVHSDNEVFQLSGSVFSKEFFRITEIMGFEVDLKPKGRMLFVKNKDVPGVIGKVGTILGLEKVNISGYLLSKVEEKNFAYSIIKVDNEISNETVSNLLEIDELIEIRQLNL